MCGPCPPTYTGISPSTSYSSPASFGKRAVVLDALARPEVLRDLERLQYASERFLALDTQSGERGLVAGADPEDGPPVAHLVEGGHL